MNSRPTCRMSKMDQTMTCESPCLEMADWSKIQTGGNRGVHFSGSGTLEYQFVPGLWFEIGNLSMGLSHWPFFSWPMGNYTQNDTLPPILPRVLSLAAWTASSLEPIFPKVGMDSSWRALERSPSRDKDKNPRCKSTWKTGRLLWCHILELGSACFWEDLASRDDDE